MTEWPRQAQCDGYHADSVRQERTASRGWEPGELARREAAQAPLATKRARADAVIRTDGSVDQTRDDIRTALRRLE